MGGVVRSVMIRMGMDVSGVAAGATVAKREIAGVATTAQRAQRSFDFDRANTMVGRTARNVAIGGAAILGVMEVANYRFDKSMSRVDAATHASTAEMGKFRKAAIQAGADTSFSASEAADGITELAKAGVTARDILGGGLKGALGLAAAGELGVGESAEYMATALTQFHLPGTQAAHVADLLAAGAGKAQGEVSDMALALSYAGVPAAQLGVSIEETAGSIALLARNGIIGDRAGTSLRGILSSLTSPSQIAAKTMRQLGIEVFDASGNFKGMDGLAQELHTSLSGLTQAERANALGKIFGNQQLGAANVLYQAGAKGVREWTRNVNDAGYAQDTARRKLNNLAGDIEYLKGDLDSLFLQRGAGAQQGLRDLVQGVDHLVVKFSKLPDHVQSGVVKMIAFGTAASAALFVVSKIVGAARNVGSLFRAGRGLTAAAGIASASRVQPVFVTNWQGMAAAGAAGSSGAGVAGGAAAGAAVGRAGAARMILGRVAITAASVVLAGQVAKGILGGLEGLLPQNKPDSGLFKDFAQSGGSGIMGQIKSRNSLDRSLEHVLALKGGGGLQGFGIKSNANLGKLFGMGDIFDDDVKRVKDLDTAMANLKVPSDRLGAFRFAMHESGLSAEELRKVLPKTAAAMDGVTNKTRQGSSAFRAANGILNSTVRQQQRYNAVLKTVPKHIRSYVSTPGAVHSLGEMRRLTSQYKLTPRQVRTIMRLQGFSETQIKIFQNRRAYQSLPKQVRTALRADTVKSMADVRALQRRYYLTPKQLRTLVQLAGVPSARAALQSYYGMTTRIPRSITTTLFVQRRGGFGTAGGVHLRASGGPVEAELGQSRGPKDDSILAALSHREWVQPVASRDYYGDDFMEAVRTRRYPRALARGFGEGGSPSGPVFTRAPAYNVAGAQSLAGLRITGTLHSEWGPVQVEGMIDDAIGGADDMAGMRRRAGAG